MSKTNYTTDEKYTTGEYYHVFNKNLDTLKVFKKKRNCERFLGLIKYYQYKETPCSYSDALTYTHQWQLSMNEYLCTIEEKKEKLVDILAYCIMPTHFHFLLRQVEDRGISTFLSNTLNGFTRYYNIKHDRKGPLWIGRSKNVLILNDAHLWEESRYIHRNPVKAGLVEHPLEWKYSSYAEYLNQVSGQERFCATDLILKSIQDDYQSFIEDFQPRRLE